MAAHLHVCLLTHPCQRPEGRTFPNHAPLMRRLLLQSPSGLAPLSLEPELHHMAVPKQVSGWGKDVMAAWRKQDVLPGEGLVSSLVLETE